MGILWGAKTVRIATESRLCTSVQETRRFIGSLRGMSLVWQTPCPISSARPAPPLACRAGLGDNRRDGRNEHKTDDSSRALPDRPPPDTGLGRGNWRAVLLWATRESAERCWEHSQTQSDLCRRTRRPRRGPSRLWALHGQASAEGPAQGRTAPRTRRGRSKIRE